MSMTGEVTKLIFAVLDIDFYFGHVFFHVFNVFYIFQTFFYLKKTLTKFSAASMLTRSTFKITATK